jgi:hypothetical protein
MPRKVQVLNRGHYGPFPDKVVSRLGEFLLALPPSEAARLPAGLWSLRGLFEILSGTKERDQKKSVHDLIVGVIRHTIDRVKSVEGAAAAGYIDESGLAQSKWAEHFISSFALVNGDRSVPRWCLPKRQNISLPLGLIYEIESLREHLLSTGRRVSFSGFLEIAARQLLDEYPRDDNDERFFNEDGSVRERLEESRENQADIHTIAELVDALGTAASKRGTKRK